jgi:hypothetical protein
MTTEQIPETYAERAEVARDLQNEARQMLGRTSQRQDWDIIDASPKRQIAVLYSMLNGERVEVFDFQVEDALGRKLSNGSPMFTAHKDRAPTYRPGKVKCFLHPESEDAEVLREIGIFGTCTANELQTLHSKRIHAQHKHPQAWAAYQEYINQQRDQEYREQGRQQIAATLAIAEATARPKRGKAAD